MMWNSLLPVMFAEPIICRTYHCAARLVLGLLLGERRDAGREVTAEDDRERPEVADQVRGRVGREREQELRAGEQPGTARSPSASAGRPCAGCRPSSSLFSAILRLPAMMFSVSRSCSATPYWKNIISRNAHTGLPR